MPRFAEHAGGARIFLKREDLNHTGSHKINNVLGQALLTKRMGKTRVIAETGAGQHGVATATACALFGLECTIYMGEIDTQRQALNVARMRMLGAEVIAVKSGSRTLKDAINEAFRDWVANVDRTHYLFGTVAGPHPFPAMVRDFHRVIGVEARRQILERAGRLPDAAVACVGGGSNAIGLFHAFIPDAGVRLIGCEPAGHGVETGEHAATLTAGEPGILHGSRSYVLQDEEGQITEPYSISAGLDYPGIGPEHSYLKDSGRAEYRAVTDDAAMQALRLLSRTEGIIPAIESAHALAGALEVGKELGKDGLIVVNLSGRGDKDMDTAARYFGLYDTGADAVVAADADSDDRRDRGGRQVSGNIQLLGDTLAGAKAEGRSALIAYLPAGFPTVDGGIDAIKAVFDGGADIVEVGLPHSDPVLDGPVIQTADDIALRGGVKIADVMRTVREAYEATGKPVLVMTYWNPIDRYGVERFTAELAEAGGAGCILPDLPVQESGAVEGARREARPRHRLRRRAQQQGRAARRDHRGGQRVRVRRLADGRHRHPGVGRRAGPGPGAAHPAPRTDLPVCVGLGVSDAAQAAEVAGFADGVIVGSAFVKRMLDAPDHAAGARGRAGTRRRPREGRARHGVNRRDVSYRSPERVDLGPGRRNASPRFVLRV